MTDRPLFFSVVIPLYNKEKSISRTVHSVLAQDFADFELIVINDGSTDGGPHVVSEIHDPRVRLVHQANAGVSAARNLGVELSRSRLVAFLDADDQWQPTYLSTIRALVDRFPQAGIYATAYATVDARGKHVSGIDSELLDGKDEGVLRNYFRAACAQTPPIHTSSICISKSAHGEVGGFPADISAGCGEDVALWAKVALAYDIVVTRQCGAVYYQVGTENNTGYRYFGGDAYFDYLGLLQGQSEFPYYDDLEMWVVSKMYEIAVAALVHDDDRDTARRMLRLVQSRHWRQRRRLVQSLLLMPPRTRRTLFRMKQRMKAIGAS